MNLSLLQGKHLPYGELQLGGSQVLFAVSFGCERSTMLSLLDGGVYCPQAEGENSDEQDLQLCGPKQEHLPYRPFTKI